MHSNFIAVCVLLLCTIISISSCQSFPQATIDTEIFTHTEPLDTISVKTQVSDYEGGKEYIEEYTLSFYQEKALFSEAYPHTSFTRKEIPWKPEYDSLLLLDVSQEFLYFYKSDQNHMHTLFRYNMQDDTEEVLYSFYSENQISFQAFNDQYIIWKEDENANWLKVSLHCYDIKNKTNKKIFTYSRDTSDYMYSWNFDKPVLDGDYLYFNNTVSFTNAKANVNLYAYDLIHDTYTIIDEIRATQPMPYHKLSWLSYDDDTNEYLIKNKNSAKTIVLGHDFYSLATSSKTLVGYKINANQNPIFYFNGKETIPVLQSTKSIDQVNCTDAYIAWDGWNHGNPFFYSIKSREIVEVDCLEAGLRYRGIVSDDYIVFEAHEYIPDTEVSQDAITTKSLIYYFVETKDLN